MGEIKIFTIGVYGADEESFFGTLQRAGIDTFCDIRRRRGMRGSLYAFANSGKLQERLAGLGIRYLHLKELAPDEQIRERQKAEDKELRIAKRSRQALGATFAREYCERCLAPLDAAGVAASLGPEAEKVVLFCVERHPEACHRSLVAGWLRDALGVEVEDLRP